MAPEKEVNDQGKKSVGDSVDEFFDANESAQESNSPETTQTATPDENVSDTVKTEESSEQADLESDKNQQSVPYQRFQDVNKKSIEREQKLKETEAKLKELEASSSVYSRLLDDPGIYKKFLEAQGFRPEEVARAMADKGFQTPQTGPAAPTGLDDKTKRSIAEAACEKLGWNIKSLTPEQQAYIRDQVALTEQVFDLKLKEALDARLGPLEGFVKENEAAKKLQSGYEEAKKLAREEFKDEFQKNPQYWEKVIEPAMHKYLDDLDKRDPRNTIKIDPDALYEKATRQILKERRFAQESQEARDVAKKNARPLQPGPSQPGQKTNNLKGKNVGETVDKFLESAGWKE